VAAFKAYNPILTQPFSNKISPLVATGKTHMVRNDLDLNKPQPPTFSLLQSTMVSFNSKGRIY
jgi:hypothetical protein